MHTYKHSPISMFKKKVSNTKHYFATNLNTLQDLQNRKLDTQLIIVNKQLNHGNNRTVCRGKNRKYSVQNFFTVVLFYSLEIKTTAKIEQTTLISHPDIVGINRGGILFRNEGSYVH